MASKNYLVQFSHALSSDLKAKDKFKTVLENSMAVRDWISDQLAEPPHCEVCGAILDNKHLSFCEESDLATRHRVCLNRVWCRTMKSDPPDPEEMQTGGSWIRRVGNLYLNVTL